MFINLSKTSVGDAGIVSSVVSLAWFIKMSKTSVGDAGIVSSGASGRSAEESPSTTVNGTSPDDGVSVGSDGGDQSLLGLGCAATLSSTSVVGVFALMRHLGREGGDSAANVASVTLSVRVCVTWLADLFFALFDQAFHPQR